MWAGMSIPDKTSPVRYYEPDGDSVINIFGLPWMRVNYGHDWVGGTYPAGHTFWITVTSSIDVVKDTAEIETEPGWGWAGAARVLRPARSIGRRGKHRI